MAVRLKIPVAFFNQKEDWPSVPPVAILTELKIIFMIAQ